MLYDPTIYHRGSKRTCTEFEKNEEDQDDAQEEEKEEDEEDEDYIPSD